MVVVEVATLLVVVVVTPPGTVVVVVLVVVVVVGGPPPMRSVRIARAMKLPSMVASWVTRSMALGARRRACTSEVAEKCTAGPFTWSTMSPADGAEPAPGSGPRKALAPRLTRLLMRSVEGPLKSTCAERPVRRLQKK